MKAMHRFMIVAGLAGVSLAAQAADSVRYTAPGKSPVNLDAKALAAMPQASVKAGAHGAPPSEWQGVALVDVLRAEGAPMDKALRGKALAQFVRVGASDGYQVVFSLGELDPGLGATRVLLVNRHDGQPLDAKDGPFRLVVPGDGRPARWVHNVTRIELVDGTAP